VYLGLLQEVAMSVDIQIVNLSVAAKVKFYENVLKSLCV